MAAAVSSLYGQGVRGSIVSSPWWPDRAGAHGWEVTQGYGPTDVTLEPAGHGQKYWHAGVDIGLDCGTIISLPGELISATLKAVDNPGGYGIALVVTISGRLISKSGATAPGVDIWLGHLAQRLASGSVRGGDHLAASNNTGNSTGCHVHFEVRPTGGKYGSDIDPSDWLLNPAKAADAIGASTSSSGTDPLTQAIEAAFAPVAASIQTAEERFVAGMVGTAQVGLGSLMLLAGSGFVAFGVRGLGPQQAYASAARFVRSQRKEAAARTLGRERQTQGAIAGDVRQQQTEAREGARQAARERMENVGRYRAGLISRQEAQRRLGEPVRATGRRSSRSGVAVGLKPGTYRTRGGSTVDLRAQHAARVRASRVKGAKPPPTTPAAGKPERIPF